MSTSMIQSIESAYRNAFAMSEMHSRERAKPLARRVLQDLQWAARLPDGERPDDSWFSEIRSEMEYIVR